MLISLSSIPTDFQEKMAVFHAIDKPVERLTVNEICMKCGISRKRFYELFDSKHAIVQWYLIWASSVSVYEAGRALSWRTSILRWLQLIEEERQYFEVDQEEAVNRQEGYYLFMARRCSISMEETLTQFRKIKTTPMLKVELPYMRLLSAS